MQKHIIVSVAGIFLIGSNLLGQPVPSRIFDREGHGRYANYYFPDDDERRVTALHDVVTPHIVWAKPLRGGSLRVLAIAHKSMGRWPVELAQRFEFQVNTVYGHDREKLGATRGEFRMLGLFVQGPEDVEARLLQAMNEPIDVIISDIPVKTLGDKVTPRLYELLDRGVGYLGPTENLDLNEYVVAEQAQRQIIESAVPIEGLRLLSKQFGSAQKAAGTILKLWTHDRKGRVADFEGYPRDAQRPEPNRLQYLEQLSMEQEAWCSLVGRAALWAAQRRPASSALTIEWPAESVERQSMPYPLRVRGHQSLSLWARVWDADGRLRYEAAEPTIPSLPAGRYFVGVQALSGGHVDDWAFRTIHVQSDVDIAAIELDSEHKNSGETVQATVKLTAAPQTGSKLRFDVLDNHGRSVSTNTRPATQESVFNGDFGESRHMYNYVNVQLLGPNGSVIAEDRKAFFLRRPSPPHDDLTWIVWEAGNNFNPRARILFKQYAKHGMNAVLGGGGVSAAMGNVHPIFWVLRLKGVQVDDEGITGPCLTSPGYRLDTVSRMKDVAKQNLSYSPLFYYLGDDVHYTGKDACWSPTCRADLAAWAQRRYGTLEKINQAWGTSYGDFDEIEPRKSEEAFEAARRGDLATFCHYVDHQLSEDEMFAGFFRYCAEALREVAPDIRANLGSSTDVHPNPGGGQDFWHLAEGTNLVFQYPTPMTHDIFRCATAPNAYQGMWYGGYGVYQYYPFAFQEYMPWWGMFRRVNLHGLYYGGQGSTWYTARILGADLGPMQGTEKVLNNLIELQGGIAKLLFNARRENDGVAVLYSHGSFQTSAIYRKGLPRPRESMGGGNTLYMWCWEAMGHLMRDMGYSFDVVPSSHLEGDRFMEQGFRVLVLPLNLKISEAEAETIRRFVRGGGVLIADVFPGVFDEICRVNHPGVLADVFGVKFAGGIPGPQVRVQSASTMDGFALGEPVVDGGLELDGAQAMGKAADGTPILMVHQYGQGHAILLNVLSRDYHAWRMAATEMPLRDAVARLLSEQTGLRPAIRCEVGTRGGKTHHIQVTEFHRYELDGANYVGLLRHPVSRPFDSLHMADQRPKSVWINFDRKAHVYDIRREMYRGHTEKIEDVIYPGRAELYSLLPYEVRDLKLAASHSGGAINANIQIIPGGVGTETRTHVFRIEIIDPDGRKRAELARNIVAPLGRLDQRIFLGHNSQPGTWHLGVRDVASGTRRVVAVKIDPRETDHRTGASWGLY